MRAAAVPGSSTRNTLSESGIHRHAMREINDKLVSGAVHLLQQFVDLKVDIPLHFRRNVHCLDRLAALGRQLPE